MSLQAERRNLIPFTKINMCTFFAWGLFHLTSSRNSFTVQFLWSRGSIDCRILKEVQEFCNDSYSSLSLLNWGTLIFSQHCKFAHTSDKSRSLIKFRNRLKTLFACVCKMIICADMHPNIMWQIFNLKKSFCFCFEGKMNQEKSSRNSLLK